jgi:predicted enzyme related to lactoylglutathione lyase
MPKKLKAAISLVSVPSDDAGKTADFYSKLLDIDLARTLEDTESYHTTISEDGIDLFTGPRRHSGDSVMVYFHVDDLDAALTEAGGLGGKVVWGPQDITMSDKAFQAYEEAYKQEERGGPPPSKRITRAAVVQEPGGSSVGLLQVESHMHSHYKVGRHQKPIDDKQLSHLKRGMESARKVHGAGRGR